MAEFRFQSLGVEIPKQQYSLGCLSGNWDEDRRSLEVKATHTAPSIPPVSEHRGSYRFYPGGGERSEAKTHGGLPLRQLIGHDGAELGTAYLSSYDAFYTCPPQSQLPSTIPPRTQRVICVRTEYENSLDPDVMNALRVRAPSALTSLHLLTVSFPTLQFTSTTAAAQAGIMGAAPPQLPEFRTKKTLTGIRHDL